MESEVVSGAIYMLTLRTNVIKVMYKRVIFPHVGHRLVQYEIFRLPLSPERNDIKDQGIL